jgi:hypothetical protein
MGQLGKPTTLDAMKHLAHSIDARHWERIREKSRSDKSDNFDSDSDNSNQANKKPNNNHNPNKTNNPDADTQLKDSDKSDSAPIPISNQLGKDGKLTPQERQRRFDNNLCLFCGGIGHTVNSCPKSTSSASKAKARAAQASKVESVDSSS